MAKVISFDERLPSFEHISGSQIRELSECEQRYAFKYALGLPNPPTSSLALGKAIDHATNAFNTRKIETHENTMPLADVVEIAVAALESAKDDVQWNEPLSELKDETPGMVKVLYDGSLTITQPVAVQEEIKVEFGTWHITGYVDIRDVSGVRRDYKTSKARWPENKPLTEIQPVLYTMGEPGESTFGWDIAVRNKTPVIQRPTRIVGPRAKEGMRKIAAHFKVRADQIRLNPEAALPTGYGGWLCSHRQCPFHVECYKRWGQPIVP